MPGTARLLSLPTMPLCGSRGAVFGEKTYKHSDQEQKTDALDFRDSLCYNENKVQKGGVL